MESIVYNGKRYKVFDFRTDYGKKEKFICVPSSYLNNSTLAMNILCIPSPQDEENYFEPWAVLTVNLGVPHGIQDDTHAFVDTNNGSWGAERFISETHLGEPTGLSYPSGFCTYPLYVFHPERCFAD